MYTLGLDENGTGGVLYTASWICSKRPCTNFVLGCVRYKILALYKMFNPARLVQSDFETSNCTKASRSRTYFAVLVILQYVKLSSPGITDSPDGSLRDAATATEYDPNSDTNVPR